MRVNTITVLSLVLLGCQTMKPELAPMAPPAPAPPQMPAKTEPEPSFENDDPAIALAQQVFEAAGGTRLDQVSELRFTFLEFENGRNIMTAQHRWDRKHNRDRISWRDAAGEHDVTIDLATQSSAGAGPEDTKLAYARWLNDTYWLCVPLKLFDPGIQVALDLPRMRAGRKYQILRISFDQSSPNGDIYWLFIDPSTYTIAGWEMLLQGNAPPPVWMSFAPPTSVGGLRLSLDHSDDDGTLQIKFNGVQSLSELESSDFSASTSKPNSSTTAP